MQEKVRSVVKTWRKELLFLLVAMGVVVPASTAQAQCIPDDTMHYHAGADHCDDGGTDCVNICVPPV